jgi:hypothetical protein
MVAGMGTNAWERRGSQVVTLAAQASSSSQAVSLQTARSSICSSTTVVLSVSRSSYDRKWFLLQKNLTNKTLWL